MTAYAPMLNPTELCFNLLKQQTDKTKMRNHEEMKNSITKAIELLNQKDLFLILCKLFWERCV